MKYTFKCTGKELAKVLFYYGLIEDVKSDEYKIVCPFHEDVNPSMIIDLHEGKYYCFGCGESGDAVSFVRKMNKDKNDLESLKIYFKILKSDKCEKVKISHKKKKKKPSKQALIEAKDYYYGLSKTDWLNDKSEDVVKARRYMLKRGFKPRTLKMCKAKVNYNSSYGLIFPMLDNGKFHGWVCRTMKKEVEKKRKYLYNEGFSRKNTLVGDYKKGKPLYIVEGYMDMLKIKQNGVNNVVAILGWKISEEQVKKIKDEGITHVISTLDNDECGREGTKVLRKYFTVTRFRYIKNIKDPGEMNEQLFKKMNNKTLEEYYN